MDEKKMPVGINANVCEIVNFQVAHVSSTVIIGCGYPNCHHLPL